MVRKIISVLILSALLVSCSRNSITGRNQFKFIPESELQTMASQEYRQFLSSNKVVSSSVNRDAEMVERVGKRIRKSVETYYAEKGLSEQLAGFNWEYHLVENSAVNAWCMPGGKIVVYTGLLP